MWKDLAYSFRTLRRSPVFTTVAVLSLALGIGVNTAIFSLLDQVVLRSLPVRDPESLVVFHRALNPNGHSSSDSSESVFSYPMYRDLRDHDPAFVGVVARMGTAVQLGYQGNLQSASAEIVSGNFFSTLGVDAAIGRLLTPQDDGAPGSNRVAVLSHAYWSAYFGNDSAILNQTISLNGHPFVVIGVVDPRFNGIFQGKSVDLYVPIAMQRTVMPSFDALEDRTVHWLNLFARLKPGESMRQAQAATDVVYHSLVALEATQQAGDFRSQRDRDEFLNHRTDLRPAAHGISALREKWEKPLRVLMVMVGLVLLIACANVAGLLLARATGRQREIAVRLALGASRSALAKQLLLEGMVVALAGGALGLLVRQWSTASLLRILPRDAAGSWLTAALDWRLLGFAVALSVASGVLFALAPAIQSTRPDLAETLKDQTARVASGGKHARLRQLLVTGQIALSMLLVVGALLFTASARNLLTANLGFRTEHLLAFNVNATLTRTALAPAVAFYRDLERQLAAIPEVTGVAAAIGGPFSGSTTGGNISIQGYHAREDEYTGANIIAVGSGYFRTMGVQMRAGREFTERDDGAAPHVIVVNEAFVKRYFGNSNPIGRRLMFGDSNHPVFDKEIVGVVADARSDIRAPAKESIYMPYAQWDKPARLFFYVRTAGDEKRVASAVVRTVRQADASLPAPTIQSVEVRLRDSLYTERLIAILSAAFGVLATLLAAIGLYGVMAYAVARRTGEIGIRMALGALPAEVIGMILRDAFKIAGLGIGIGLLASIGLGRVVESQLFGVKAGNPFIFAASGAVLGICALMAALLPAWRASRVDPLAALKYE